MATPSTARSYAEVGQQVSERLSPAKLQPLQTNADLIANHIDRNGLNGFSVDDWMIAIWALHAEGKLLWKIDPVQQTSAQKAIENAKKQEVRMRKDYLNSIKGKDVQEVQRNNAVDAQDAKNLAEVKELKSIKSEIRSRIEGYRANHPTVGTDYSRTESGQNTLRGVLASKVGGSGSLEQLLLRVTLVNGKDVLSAVNNAFFKMS
jgi:hypothetical protein